MNLLTILTILRLLAKIGAPLADALEDGKITNKEVIGIIFKSLEIGIDEAATKNKK